MRVVMINASLKKEGSVSSLLIERMIPYLKDCEYGIWKLSDPMDHRTRERILKAADAFVIVTPVSMGGIPSLLSGLLSEMEFSLTRKNIPVCTVLHGEQEDASLLEHERNILKIWSKKCQMHLCMNILIGGSDQLLFMKNIPDGNASLHKLNHAYAELADALKGNEKEDVSFSLGYPFVYKKMMERKWKKELAGHGLSKIDGAGRITENSFIDK